ncbi:hypothetical protein ATJ93_4600 [Halopiger aswanensis]|uniref:Uncharacterized protein n=1 Tax=Halopiger aswanensis TaxID=148449 RepID=A0A3R7EBQ5_9EURY|nr:hypothetical protein ATJ93_4600 [Halopiger aswanensis]
MVIFYYRFYRTLSTHLYRSVMSINKPWDG